MAKVKESMGNGKECVGKVEESIGKATESEGKVKAHTRQILSESSAQGRPRPAQGTSQGTYLPRPLSQENCWSMTTK